MAAQPNGAQWTGAEDDSRTMTVQDKCGRNWTAGINQWRRSKLQLQSVACSSNNVMGGSRSGNKSGAQAAIPAPILNGSPPAQIFGVPSRSALCRSQRQLMRTPIYGRTPHNNDPGACAIAAAWSTGSATRQQVMKAPLADGTPISSSNDDKGPKHRFPENGEAPHG